MFHLYRSNRLERLADALADILRATPPGPLERAWLAVPSHGMTTWLSHAVADRLGVWCGFEVMSVRGLVEKLVSTTLDLEPEALAPFRADCLRWSIAELLPGLLGQAAFVPLARYLAQDDTGQRLHQLSAAIAQVFDDYTVYRPDLVSSWQRSGEQDWQPLLFQALLARLEQSSGERKAPRHIALAIGATSKAWQTDAASWCALPGRVQVFGAASMPPQFLALLQQFATKRDVCFFLQSPSREFFADLQRKPRTCAPESGQSNRLLVSLGRVSRELQSQLESVDYHEPDEDLYVDPCATGRTDMLAVLQSDVLGLVDRGALPLCEQARVADGDQSLSIHSCHSMLREVEVLRDQLYAAFDDPHTALQPEDVVIMAPDIEAYAPLLEAVFGAPAEGLPLIPLRVADRSARRECAVIDAFLALLELAPSRFKQSAVFDFFALSPVHERFGLSANDVALVRALAVEVGARWGMNGAHRERHGQPALEQNTLRFAVERLLLGYAAPAPQDGVFEGVLPGPTVDRSEAERLGHLAAFIESLFEIAAELERPRSLAAWRESLTRALDALIGGTLPAHLSQHGQVQHALDELAELGTKAGFVGVVSLEVVRDALSDSLCNAGPSRGFQGGAVTCCSLKPMRSIPFQVVCLLGLDEGAFPRLDRPRPFDLIAATPREGDRSSRADDRYLFLEALLSAQSRLILTYVGQSAADNTSKPPSVLVTELKEVLRATFAHEGASANSEVQGITVVHPLQSFSPRYFGGDPDPRLFSYQAHELRAAAVECDDSPRVTPLLIQGVLPSPALETNEITLENLLRFYKDPLAFLLQRRVGINLRRSTQDVGDREPMEVDALLRYQLGTRLLEELPTLNPTRGEALARAEGLLPLGTLGGCCYNRIAVEAATVADSAAALLPVEPLATVEIALALTVDERTVRLVGAIDHCSRSRRIGLRFADIRAEHALGFWLEHLVLLAAEAHADGFESVLVGRKETLAFGPVEEPATRLSELVAFYLQSAVLPAPFLPAAALAYAETLAQDKPEARALGAAAQAWQKAEEGAPLLLRRLLEELNPWRAASGTGLERFTALATVLVAPLVAAKLPRRP